MEKFHVFDLTQPPTNTYVMKNSAGKDIVLNEMEQRAANTSQVLLNNLGYEINITTMTTVLKKISEQKFFEVAPADYIPIVVGEGAWSTNLLNYREYTDGDNYETGILGLGEDNTRMASVDAAVDSVPAKVYNWGKSISWNLIQLQQAAKAGNWDLVAAKERARKKNWDLGIQRIAFWGAQGFNGANGNCLGLFNQAGITTDSTTIPTFISLMTTAQLKTFCANVLLVYQQNNNYTTMPTHFIIPTNDYLGLAAQTSPDFPIKSTLAVLEETFQVMTMNKSFKILPVAYANRLSTYNTTGLNYYALLNYDEESLRMDIPVDYTTTLANSVNNFSFQNAGYGQFAGVRALRPLELYYFTTTN